MMKKILALLLITSHLAQAGLPPTTIKGQSDTSPVTTFNLQTPGYGITRLGGPNALIETGQKNYIPDPGAENPSGPTACTTYSNTAANTPSNGTGGTATGLTFSRSTSSPLRGTGSYLIVQTNSTNIQGKGVSCAFTTDSADKAKPLSISFDYNASSTFVASNGTTAPLNDGTTTTNAGNSDVEVFVYDVTNSALIPVNPQVITANGANNYTFKGTFQTASNSTSYRLIFHVATANANVTGWNFKFDNVYVGPSAGGAGSNVSPTVQKFTSGSGTYTTPTSPAPLYIKVRMVGGGGGGGGSGTASNGAGGAGGNTTFGTTLLVANGGGAGSGAGGGGGGGTASLGTGPSGTVATGGNGGSGVTESVSTTQAPGGSGGVSYFGGAGPQAIGAGGSAQTNTGSGGAGGSTGGSAATTTGGGGGAGGYLEAIITNPAATYSYAVGASGSAGTAGTGGFNGGAGAAGYIEVTEYYGAPSGATDGDGRVVGGNFTGAPPTGTLNGSYNAVTFGTTVKDTHAGLSGNTYTCQVSGLYNISAQVAVAATYAAGNGSGIEVVINGTSKARGDQVAGSSSVTVLKPSVSLLSYPLTAGDTVVIKAQSDGTSPTYASSTDVNWFTIARNSGPAAIAASESVNARVYLTGSQALANSATPSQILLSGVSKDSHSAFSSNQYVVPSSGTYDINAGMVIAFIAEAANTSLSIYVNGSAVAVGYANGTMWAGGSFNGLTTSAQTLISLKAGDTVKLYGAQQNANAASRNIIGEAGGTSTWMTIKRVGN